MKTPPAKQRPTGFTLIEVLVVLAIIAILAAMLLPGVVVNRPVKSYQVMCMSNQRQIVLGFIMWQNDHAGKFPWQSLVATNRAMELLTEGHPSTQFKTTSEYIKNPKVYLCPTDKSKSAATNYTALTDDNVSYFVNFDPGTNYSVTILTGDRHLENQGKPVRQGLFTYSKDAAISWTRELHGTYKIGSVGVLSFTDGHVERVLDKKLTATFQQQGSATNRLAIP